jgi:hypothetical protein
MRSRARVPSGPGRDHPPPRRCIHLSTPSWILIICVILAASFNVFCVVWGHCGLLASLPIHLPLYRDSVRARGSIDSKDAPMRDRTLMRGGIAPQTNVEQTNINTHFDDATLLHMPIPYPLGKNDELEASIPRHIGHALTYSSSLRMRMWNVVNFTRDRMQVTGYDLVADAVKLDVLNIFGNIYPNVASAMKSEVDAVCNRAGGILTAPPKINSRAKAMYATGTLFCTTQLLTAAAPRHSTT